MLEKEIEKAVCKYAESKNVWVKKFVSPSSRGCPDRIFITSLGKIFFIEFKSKGKPLTTTQNLIRKELLSRNVNYYVCDDVDEGELIIDLETTREIAYLPN